MFGRTVCSCMVTFLLGSCQKAGCLKSRQDPVEAVVVVGGVVAGVGRLRFHAAANDASRAPVMRPRRGNGVLAVVAAPVRRQRPFTVAEHRAVLGVLERTTGED